MKNTMSTVHMYMYVHTHPIIAYYKLPSTWFFLVIY